MADGLSTDQFSLKWNNFSSNLTSGFLSHLTDKDLVDVTLAVQGKLLQAHKLVLSVCSPYFKDIFKVNPCRHPVVILKDMGYQEVEALLRFMYQGEVNVKQDDLAAFLKIAETLQVKGLTGEGNKVSDSVSRSSTPSHCSNDAFETCPKFDINASQTDSETIIEQSKLAEAPSKTKRPQDPMAPVAPSTAKKSRTSPPPLKEIDALIPNPLCQTAKSEPQDYDDQDDSFFHEENLEELLNPKSDLDKGSISLIKEDNTNDRGQQLSSNSLIDANCLQGDSTTQGLLPFVRSSRGNLQLVHDGHIYTVHCRAGTKTYWKCVYRSTLGRCRARCHTKVGQVVVSEPAPPPHASHLDTIQSLCLAGKIIYTTGY